MQSKRRVNVHTHPLDIPGNSQYSANDAFTYVYYASRDGLGRVGCHRAMRRYGRTNAHEKTCMTQDTLLVVVAAPTYIF